MIKLGSAFLITCVQMALTWNALWVLLLSLESHGCWQLMVYIRRECLTLPSHRPPLQSMGSCWPYFLQTRQVENYSLLYLLKRNLWKGKRPYLQREAHIQKNHQKQWFIGWTWLNGQPVAWWTELVLSSHISLMRREEVPGNNQRQARSCHFLNNSRQAKHTCPV